MSSDGECGENGEWWVYLVYLTTLAPWGIMQVHDPIDEARRSINDVRNRLLMGSFLTLGSAIVGFTYVGWAAKVGNNTESATMLVGVALNTWHWVRVSRGWYSYVLLTSMRNVWEKFFDNMTAVGRFEIVVGRVPRMEDVAVIENGGPSTPVDGGAPAVEHRGWHPSLEEMEVNDSVIDNDSQGGDRALFGGNYTLVRGVILWRMVWLQGVERPSPSPGNHEMCETPLAAKFFPGDPPNHGMDNLWQEEALDELIRRKLVEMGRKTEYEVKHMHVHSLRDALRGFDIVVRGELESVSKEKAVARKQADTEDAKHDTANNEDGAPKTAIKQRQDSLKIYGGEEGQQDRGEKMMPNHPESRVQTIWEMMTWITAHSPKPMENIWYESKELMMTLHEISGQNARGAVWPSFPGIESWFRIAKDIARQRDSPLLLSVFEFKRFALRIASSSALLAYNPGEYDNLVTSVYNLGILARWTHGWSGRLSCYSALWTPGNVGMALLGGLTLLVIRKNVVTDSVRCLLVGMASDTIMGRYLPDKVRAARTKELAYRYSNNKGKTCRGSGVKCVRKACVKLGLPPSASQLDGAVAFAVGWAMEALEGLPGDQDPRDGNNHDQIEDIFCSSRAYRFTDERL